METSTTWQLAPHAHATSVDGDVVILDLQRDAYFCLPAAPQRILLSAGRRSLVLEDRVLLDALRAANLVVADSAADADAALEPPAPMRSALMDNFDRPRWRDLRQAVPIFFDVWSVYRGAGMGTIVRSADRRPGASPILSNALLRYVADFHRWAPYAPTSAKCLLRSFMLLRGLRRQGFDAYWVFGVRTWPFHAHCWLQCEDVVLDEQPDHVRAFTPILVV